MRNGSTKAAAGIFCAVVIILSSSCERRPLLEPAPATDVLVEVDINTIANVTCDIYNDKIPVKDVEPDVMRVLFFHETEDKLLYDIFVQEKVSGPSGEVNLKGKAAVPPGNYRLLTYSFGAVTTYVGNYNSFYGAYAYCDPLPESFQQSLHKSMAYLASKNSSLSKIPEKQPIMEQPDHIFAGSNEHEYIPYHEGNHVVEIDAESLVESYYLQVYIDGMKYVNSASAVLTSMASSAKMATGEKDYDNPTAVYIPLVGSYDGDKPVICAVFNTFGRIPESHNQLSITFNITRADGEIFGKTYDISELFLSENCIKHHWLLLDDTIDIPAPEITGEGSGYDPTIKDWEDVETDIII